MSVVEVPGARLHYEARGDGPLLVVVPGASGEGDTYANLADGLSARYRVVIYDRRGYSRSQLHGAQDYAHRLETDADDVRRLIQHLNDEPATIFGNSSGALVALQVLIQQPDVVRKVIAHEPPWVRLLPDGEAWARRSWTCPEATLASSPSRRNSMPNFSTCSPADPSAFGPGLARPAGAAKAAAGYVEAL